MSKERKLFWSFFFLSWMGVIWGVWSAGLVPLPLPISLTVLGAIDHVTAISGD